MLRVLHTLDRETLAEHSLVVTVSDGKTSSSVTQHTVTTSFRIRLLDVNDSPPSFIDPRPQTSVSELSPVGTVLMQVKAVSMDEGDNAVIHYRLLEEQPEFMLNASTGKTVNASFHFRLFCVLESSSPGTFHFIRSSLKFGIVGL